MLPGAQEPEHGSILLAYVDESYTPDEFHLGAVLVDARAARLIEQGFEGILQDYAGRFGLTHRTELHGHPLFQGRDERKGVPTRVRINIYQRALTVIGASGASIILRGMNVVRQQQRYARPDPPHEIVLGHLLERVNSYAREQNAHALVLADEVHSQDRHRTTFRDFRTDGTPGYRSSTLPRLLDTIHFAPSHHSRLLQAADLVTFLHRRRRTHPERDARAAEANEAIWATVSGAVAHSHCWMP